MITNEAQFSATGVSLKKRFPTASAARWRLGTGSAIRLLLLLLTLPAGVQAQYNYTTNNGTIIITKYTGSDAEVTIPSIIDGLPVTIIGGHAFAGCTNLASVTIPNSVANIGFGAFQDCTSLSSVTIPSSVTRIETSAFNYCYDLTGIYFKGNAPSFGLDVFIYDNNATVYYLPGTTGWKTTFAYRPAKLWNPQPLTSDSTFGVQTNRFGFNITGTSGLVVVVEACTNPANPSWLPLQTNTLASGSSYFSDPNWADYPGRFYRLRSP